MITGSSSDEARFFSDLLHGTLHFVNGYHQGSTRLSVSITGEPLARHGSAAIWLCDRRTFGNGTSFVQRSTQSLAHGGQVEDLIIVMELVHRVRYSTRIPRNLSFSGHNLGHESV